MLVSLAIRDVVLIERLDLSFPNGLCVLTGETGAGKSILLDALGLALGARGDAALVRREDGEPARQASVSAEFAVDADHPALAFLRHHALDMPEPDEALILRRILAADGRSRAFVNDQPVSVATLRELGESLVEIEGQFASRGLLDPASHRETLDAFGGLLSLRRDTADSHRDHAAATAALVEAEEAFARSRAEEEFLSHACEELQALEPSPGDENELAGRRAFLMNGEKLVGAVAEALAALAEGETEGVETRLGMAERQVGRHAEQAGGGLDPALAALKRAGAEAAEAIGLLRDVASELDSEPGELERVEDRLFTLRAVARKHGVEVDALADLRDDFTGRLAALENSSATIDRLADEAATARTRYLAAAEALSAARIKAATRLDKAVAVELPPLRLEKARFFTSVERAPESAWGPTGIDHVAFLVATNPGQEPGPLARIASGGELARFMLALKVALSQANAIPTLVFDEVDSGIGGATAAAVGERLAQLAESVQVLVVTHSPQVAARGAAHLRVAKGDGNSPVTTVLELSDDDRREEVARMLAGARVTDEARAAADSLIAGDVA